MGGLFLEYEDLEFSAGSMGFITNSMLLPGALAIHQ
jgi:hypothetical protein